MKKYIKRKIKNKSMDILTMLYDQDYVTECYEKELYDEAMQKGRAEGREDILKILIKKGIITKEEAKKELQLLK